MGQRCPHCLQYTMEAVPSGRPDPDEPDEQLMVRVCTNCDNGCDQVLEGEIHIEVTRPDRTLFWDSVTEYQMALIHEILGNPSPERFTTEGVVYNAVHAERTGGGGGSV